MAVPDLRNNSYYMRKFSPSAQSYGRPSYEDLTRPYLPPGLAGERGFTDQQQQQHRLYYRPPYSMTVNPLNPSIPFSSHQAIQEPIFPKFPPQMFDIPDIHDSNSVFNQNTFDMNGGLVKSALAPPPPPPPHQMAFEPALPVPPPPVSQSLMPPFPTEWEPRFISAPASSTNSSPITHSEENSNYDVPMSLPLTQQQNVFSSSVSKPSVKKAKSPKKRKRKDPNEPQKPVSAYSLFFRNAQAAIKSQNPNATFGDISKIVASMWDNLDNEIKRFYKRQMEAAKKEYLKQLAVYRANLSTQETEAKSVSSKEETDPPPPQQQQSLSSTSTKTSSSPSSSSASSLLTTQTDESTSRGPSGPSSSLSDVVSDHSTTQQNPRSSSVESPAVAVAAAASAHRLPISQPGLNHAQQQQQQMPSQTPPVYLKELAPGGSSLQMQPNGLGYGNHAGLPALPLHSMFQPYSERVDYFGPVGGMGQHIYSDRRYGMPGLWNHPLPNVDYPPIHESFLGHHNTNSGAGLRGLNEATDTSVKWT